MRTMARWFMVMVMVAFIGGAALAQQPRQGGGQGGFGGFGGGGFGAGGFSLKTMLITNKVLQDELKISDELKEKFTAFQTAQTAEQEKMRTLGTDDEDQIARLKIQIKAIEDRMALLKGLTTEQTKRISQIERQQMGMRAYTNAKVIAELKLSDGQKEQIKSITTEYTKDATELNGGGRGGAPGAGGAAGGRGGAGGAAGGFGGRPANPETQKKLDALKEEATEKIEKALNDEQRKQWKELIGVKFDMAKLAPRREN